MRGVWERTGFSLGGSVQLEVFLAMNDHPFFSCGIRIQPGPLNLRPSAEKGWGGKRRVHAI